MSAINADARMMVGWKETINVLLNEFFPENAIQYENGSSVSSDGDKEFEWNEIERAVRSICSGKASEMDGVIAEMI